jgi:hypothetical protein
VLDSGCTNHMTEEKDMFTSFQPSHDQSENIVFGDNGKGEVLGLVKLLSQMIIRFQMFYL